MKNFLEKLKENFYKGTKKVQSSYCAWWGCFYEFFHKKRSKNSAIKLWLDLNLKSLLPRLKNIKKRPLLNEENLEGVINKIYIRKRKKIYNETDYKIICTYWEQRK